MNAVNEFRTTSINGWRVILAGRDQYNDYSVAFNWFVEVREPGCFQGRRYEMPSKSKAQQFYLLALQHVRLHAC